MIKFNFDKNFWFGTATSGPQTEGWKGKKEYSLMDQWFQKEPEQFFEGVGNNMTNNMYETYQEDIDIMSELKLNSFRTSIQWTRLVSKFPLEKFDEDGVKFYRQYFEYIKNKGIKLVVNLYHFDIPVTLQEKGGWENRETIDEFANYAKGCFETFGDIVDHWVTFNEPIVHSEAGYLEGHHYPHIKDLKRAIQVGYNVNLASARAIQEFRSVFNNNKNKKIGVVLNLTPCYNATKNLKDIEASEIADEFYNKAFLDPAVKGKYSEKLIKLLVKENLMPSFESQDLEIISSNKVDFLGVNYYQPRRFQQPKNLEAKDLSKFFDEYIWKERVMNVSRGWEIYPKAIYDIAIEIKENYGNIEWFISENGMGVQEEGPLSNESIYIEDDYRITFISEHLYWLKKAMEEGSNCFGYQLWSFTDCWSWSNAYKNRYGFVAINLNTQERKIKKSGYWIKNVIENQNSIEFEKLIYKEFEPE